MLLTATNRRLQMSMMMTMSQNLLEILTRHLRMKTSEGEGICVALQSSSLCLHLPVYSFSHNIMTYTHLHHQDSEVPVCADFFRRLLVAVPWASWFDCDARLITICRKCLDCYNKISPFFHF